MTNNSNSTVIEQKAIWAEQSKAMAARKASAALCDALDDAEAKLTKAIEAHPTEAGITPFPAQQRWLPAYGYYAICIAVFLVFLASLFTVVLTVNPALNLVALSLSGFALVFGFYETYSRNMATIRQGRLLNPHADFSGWATAYWACIALATMAVGSVWWIALKAVFS